MPKIHVGLDGNILPHGSPDFPANEEHFCMENFQPRRQESEERPQPSTFQAPQVPRSPGVPSEQEAGGSHSAHVPVGNILEKVRPENINEMIEKLQRIRDGHLTMSALEAEQPRMFIVTKRSFLTVS